MRKFFSMVLPVLLLCVVFLPGAVCFPRTCENATHCYKECECTDSSRDFTFTCGMNFMCAENGLCETDMNQSCDEFCGNFAANGVCGSTRCDDERDCDRYAGCQTVDESGQVNGFYDCSRRFTCNEEVGACDVNYATLSDTEMCQQSQLCVFNTTVD